MQRRCPATCCGACWAKGGTHERAGLTENLRLAPLALQIVCLTVLLYAFCALFAVNSAIHSYLIVSYSHGDKVAMVSKGRKAPGARC